MTSAQSPRQFPAPDFHAAQRHEAQRLPHGLRQTVQGNHDLSHQDTFGRLSIVGNVIDIEVKSRAGRSQHFDVVDARDKLVLHGYRLDQRNTRAPHATLPPYSRPWGASYRLRFQSHGKHFAIAFPNRFRKSASSESPAQPAGHCGNHHNPKIHSAAASSANKAPTSKARAPIFSLRFNLDNSRSDASLVFDAPSSECISYASEWGLPWERTYRLGWRAHGKSPDRRVGLRQNCRHHRNSGQLPSFYGPSRQRRISPAFQEAISARQNVGYRASSIRRHASLQQCSPRFSLDGINSLGVVASSGIERALKVAQRNAGFTPGPAASGAMWQQQAYGRCDLTRPSQFISRGGVDGHAEPTYSEARSHRRQLKCFVLRQEGETTLPAGINPGPREAFLSRHAIERRAA